MSVQTADRVKEIVDKALGAIGEIATLPEITLKIIELVEELVQVLALGGGEAGVFLFEAEAELLDLFVEEKA